MKKLNIILLLLASLWGFGQNLDSLRIRVEENNPQLLALQKWLDAEEVKARTGIYPENPDVSYLYLFGNSSALGNQQEFEVMQPFRLPGYYNSKADLQKLQFEQKQALAEMEKRRILYRMYSVYFSLVWLEKKLDLLATRKAESEQLVEAMRSGFEEGEVSKPAYDKARLYNINIQNEWNKTVSDIQIRKEQLVQINGGNAVDNYVYEYPPDWQLPVLDTVINRLPGQNPEMQVAQLEMSAAEQQLRHEKMNNWPAFAAGYKYETILDQELQGFHAGVSIPLWQNTNRIKQAKLKQDWSEANYRQKESEMRTEIVTLYNEVLSLQQNYRQMKAIMEEQQITESSLELLQAGQITFTEYMVDMDLIWQTRNSYLEFERSYFTGLSELMTLVQDL
jgi:outer membrane protein TolC